MEKTPLSWSKLGEHFADEDKAREYLEFLRWSNAGPACPHRGGAEPYKVTPKAGSKTRKGPLQVPRVPEAVHWHVVGRGGVCSSFRRLPSPRCRASGARRSPQRCSCERSCARTHQLRDPLCDTGSRKAEPKPPAKPKARNGRRSRLRSGRTRTRVRQC